MLNFKIHLEAKSLNMFASSAPTRNKKRREGDVIQKAFLFVRFRFVFFLALHHRRVIDDLFHFAGFYHLHLNTLMDFIGNRNRCMRCKTTFKLTEPLKLLATVKIFYDPAGAASALACVRRFMHNFQSVSLYRIPATETRASIRHLHSAQQRKTRSVLNHFYFDEREIETQTNKREDKESLSPPLAGIYSFCSRSHLCPGPIKSE